MDGWMDGEWNRGHSNDGWRDGIRVGWRIDGGLNAGIDLGMVKEGRSLQNFYKQLPTNNLFFEVGVYKIWVTA